MGGGRCELAAGREQSGEMVDQIDLVFSQKAIEQLPVENRANNLAEDQWSQLGWKRIQVESDDGTVRGRRQAFDEPVANFARGAGDQDDWFSEHWSSAVLSS